MKPPVMSLTAFLCRWGPRGWDHRTQESWAAIYQDKGDPLSLMGNNVHLHG